MLHIFNLCIRIILYHHYIDTIIKNTLRYRIFLICTLGDDFY